MAIPSSTIISNNKKNLPSKSVVPAIKIQKTSALDKIIWFGKDVAKKGWQAIKNIAYNPPKIVETVWNTFENIAESKTVKWIISPIVNPILEDMKTSTENIKRQEEQWVKVGTANKIISYIPIFNTTQNILDEQSAQWKKVNLWVTAANVIAKKELELFMATVWRKAAMAFWWITWTADTAIDKLKELKIVPQDMLNTTEYLAKWNNYINSKISQWLQSTWISKDNADALAQPINDVWNLLLWMWWNKLWTSIKNKWAIPSAKSIWVEWWPARFKIEHTPIKSQIAKWILVEWLLQNTLPILWWIGALLEENNKDAYNKFQTAIKDVPALSTLTLVWWLGTPKLSWKNKKSLTETPKKSLTDIIPDNETLKTNKIKQEATIDTTKAEQTSPTTKTTIPKEDIKLYAEYQSEADKKQFPTFEEYKNQTSTIKEEDIKRTITTEDLIAPEKTNTKQQTRKKDLVKWYKSLIDEETNLKNRLETAKATWKDTKPIEEALDKNTNAQKIQVEQTAKTMNIKPEEAFDVLEWNKVDSVEIVESVKPVVELPKIITNYKNLWSPEIDNNISKIESIYWQTPQEEWIYKVAVTPETLSKLALWSIKPWVDWWLQWTAVYWRKSTDESYWPAKDLPYNIYFKWNPKWNIWWDFSFNDINISDVVWIEKRTDIQQSKIPQIETPVVVKEKNIPIKENNSTISKMQEWITKLEKQNTDMEKRIKNQPALKKNIKENLRKIEFIKKEIAKKIASQELNKRPDKVSIESILETPIEEKPILYPNISKVEQLADIARQNKRVALEERVKIEAEKNKELNSSNITQQNIIKEIYDSFINDKLTQDEVLTKIIDNPTLTEQNKDNLINSFTEVLSETKKTTATKEQKGARMNELTDEITSPNVISDAVSKEDLISKINNDIIIDEKQKIQLLEWLWIKKTEAKNIVTTPTDAPFDETKQETDMISINNDISKDAKDSLLVDSDKEWAIRVWVLWKVWKWITSWVERAFWLTTMLNELKVKLADWIEKTWSDIVRSFQNAKMQVASNMFKKRLKPILDTLDTKYIDSSFKEVAKNSKDIIDKSLKATIESNVNPLIKQQILDIFNWIKWNKDITSNIPELMLWKKYSEIEKLAWLQHLYNWNPDYFKSSMPELAKYLDDIQAKIDWVKDTIYKSTWKDLQKRWLLTFVWEDYQHDIIPQSVFEKYLWKWLDYTFEWKKYSFDSYNDFKRFINLNKDSKEFKGKSISTILKKKKNLDYLYVKSDLYWLVDYINEFWEAVGNDNIFKFIKSLSNNKNKSVRNFSSNLRWSFWFEDSIMQLTWINTKPKLEWFAWWVSKVADVATKIATAKILLWKASTFTQAIGSGLAKITMNTVLENIKWVSNPLVNKKGKWYVTSPFVFKDIKWATPILEKYWFLEKQDFWPKADNKSLINKWINISAWAPVDKFFKYFGSLMMMKWKLKERGIKFDWKNATDIATKFDDMMNKLDTPEQVKIENDLHDLNETISNFNKDWRSGLKLISRIPWMWALKSFGISQTWTAIKSVSNIVDWLYQHNVHWLKQVWKASWILWIQFWWWYTAYAIWMVVASKIFNEDAIDKIQDFAKKMANQMVGNPLDIAVNSILWLVNSIVFIPLKDIKNWITAITDFVKTNNPEAISLWLDKILQNFWAYQTANTISWWAIDRILKDTLWVKYIEPWTITSWWTVKWVGAWEIMTPQQKQIFKTLLFDLDTTVSNSINSQINNYVKQAKEAEKNWTEFVPNETTKNLLDILIPTMEDIDTKAWFIIKDYKEFLWWWNYDNKKSFAENYFNYTKDNDIAQNRNYTYSILSLLEDYEKTWKPLDYDGLSKLIGLDESSVLSESQDKNMTNIKNVNNKIQSFLWETYPNLYSEYSWDIMAMTKDLKQNNPVAYNNLISWIIRVKILLDKWWFDNIWKIEQSTLSNEFSSGKNKNIIDAAISTYNWTKSLSTSLAEQIKWALKDLPSSSKQDIDNRLALIEAISKLVVKDAAYTKNSSDAIAEMVNSLSQKDLQSIYDLWTEDRLSLLDKYPTLRELLQYSLSLRGKSIPKEDFTRIPKFIWANTIVQQPQQEQPIQEQPQQEPITWQNEWSQYTSSLDKVLKFIPQPTKTKDNRKSLTELLWYDKQKQSQKQTIQTSSDQSQKLTSLEKILNMAKLGK